MIPLRVELELPGVGRIEPSPFSKNVFSVAMFPDGTRRRALADRMTAPFSVEREPSGWVARTYEWRVPLVEGRPAMLALLPLVLRRVDVPLARKRISGLVLVDAPWMLSARQPRRLGASGGQLVEVMSERDRELFRPHERVLTSVRVDDVRWVAMPARFEVPLRWLVDAGATSPVDADRVGEMVVDLDGNVRRVPLAPDEEDTAPIPGFAQGFTRGALHRGVVAGFFPERLREWEELAEQVAVGVV